MLKKIPSLERLVHSLRHVPYLASKNVYRVASYIVHMDKQQLEQLCVTLQEAHTNIVPCRVCFAWIERGDQCMFCDDSMRNQSLICVVETWQDLMVIERTESYQGVYHVLGGAICPLEGVGPHDLTIEALVSRVVSGVVKELILATNQTPEGEATAAFIARKLKKSEVVVSCLARGVPVGASLEGMDRVTIYKALSERRLF